MTASRYGEIVDVNLVRDKGTGKSKGFAFIAYEDQRSTVLAVDNLNGAQVLGRIIRVDHASNYKKKEEEDEETRQRKREERGVCRAFQRGECTRGDGCKFSHDEQRAANTGGGPQDKSSRWGHEKFEVDKEGFRWGKKDSSSKATGNGKAPEIDPKQGDKWEEKKSRRHEDVEKSRDDHHRREEKRLIRHSADEFESNSREDRYSVEEKRPRRQTDAPESRSRGDQYRREERRSRRHGDDEFEPRSTEDDRRGERRSTRHDCDSYTRADRDKHRDLSSHRHRDRDDYKPKSDRWE
ncbi:zinc finger CCCH domain-containing protein 25 isoform X2 [Mangifera indica]|uniref:zinc finger CCCH domain-containing protein 25 isoform X2 n=1 Tax=Mangifera indica TaxID=29780 RepID=UPI001CFA9D5A|nr:zinc finger CCCH domain-containing protein 25 isoform X2 [Mangifera indica]